MTRKGFMGYFVAVIIAVVFCLVIILAFSFVSALANLEVKGSTEREEKFITPFIVAYASMNAMFDEKTYFQQMSYYGAGEIITPKYQDIMDYYAAMSAQDYRIGLYARGLATKGILDEKVGGIVIPIFTFEKKNEKLIITSS